MITRNIKFIIILKTYNSMAMTLSIIVIENRSDDDWYMFKQKDVARCVFSRT